MKLKVFLLMICTLCLVTGCESSGKVHDKAYLRSAVIDGDSYTLTFFSDDQKPVKITAEGLLQARNEAGLTLGKEVFTGYTELVILEKADSRAVMEALLKDWKVSPNCMTVSGKGDFSGADPEKPEGEIRLAIKQGKVPECDIITVLSQLLTERTADTAHLTPEGCKSSAKLR